MDLVLRPYTPGDAPVVVRLFRETVRTVNRKDYSDEQVRAWAPDEIDERAWPASFERNFAVVAEEGGRVVGLGEVEDNGHVGRFYVHAQTQGRGIGTAILAALEGEARRGGLGRLFTEASITARPFFEARGFVVISPQVVVCRGVEFINYRMEKRWETEKDQ